MEENKLKVTLISPPNSPNLSPINGDFNNGLDHGKVQIYSKDEIQSPEPMVRVNFTILRSKLLSFLYFVFEIFQIP